MARYLRNQVLSRRVNMEIARLRYSSSFGEYVCECGLKTCVAPISLTAEELEEIRSEPERFIVAPGHVAKFERVVHETARFQVVEKVGAGAELLAGLPERRAGQAAAG
jgi:hypothetical protein